MIKIKATRIDMYMVELLGQIHLMTEADYIGFLLNLEKLPRPSSMPMERAMRDWSDGWLDRRFEENAAKAKVVEAEFQKAIRAQAEPVEEWEPDTSVDESEVTVNDTEIRTERMSEEALDPKEAEQKEVQPVAADKPEAQGDSDTKAVESEDLLKVKGMVEKPEYQGKEPAILEPTPEPEEKPKKVPRKWTTGDFDKYIAMAIDGARPKEVMQAIARELDVNTGNATQLFYNKVRPFVPTEKDAVPEPEPEPAPKVVDPIEPRSIVESVKLTPKPVPEVNKDIKPPKTLQEVAREYKVPMDVVSEIAQMPPYDSARTFKDIVCTRESMNTKYKIESLKAVYRDTHHNVRW